MAPGSGRWAADAAIEANVLGVSGDCLVSVLVFVLGTVLVFVLGTVLVSVLEFVDQDLGAARGASRGSVTGRRREVFVREDITGCSLRSDGSPMRFWLVRDMTVCIKYLFAESSFNFLV